MLLRLRERDLDLSTPRVMGVLNVTPDSFSDGGRFLLDGRVDLARVERAAVRMVEDGAALLDIGGESTRPGAKAVSETEETDRVLPIVERLRGIDAVLSVDTRKAGVARAAIAAGAELVNDVGGLRDADLLEVVRALGAAACIMHMQGEPESMQQAPYYDDVVVDVRRFLRERIDAAVAAGIDRARLLVDPGFGFGKSLAHNLQLLRELSQFAALGCPILVGVSRKRMIGTLTGRDVEDRTAGSVAAAMLAVQNGARIVRVHDVAATVDALAVLAAVQTAGTEGTAGTVQTAGTVETMGTAGARDVGRGQ